MLRLLHDKDLPEAFNVSPQEKDMLVELVTQLIASKEKTTISWAVERLWIDERFSDNLRAMAIFVLGYTYALQNERREKHGRDYTY